MSNPVSEATEMPGRPRVWWWNPKCYWVTDMGGKRIYFAKGWRNKKHAEENFQQLV